MIDYRNFRLSKLNTPEFSHLKYLFFWPIYGLVFTFLERFARLDYTYIHCALDDKIPFLEWFVIPYLFWFVYMVGMLLYSLFFDKKCFIRFMKLIIIVCSASCIAYIVFPSAQALRPEIFPRDNIFTDIVKAFYDYDTNTNVCPSVHVATSIIILLCAWNSKYFSKVGWRIAFFITTILISLSTMFMKQHSVIDVIWAIVLVAVVDIGIRVADSVREKLYAVQNAKSE